MKEIFKNKKKLKKIVNSSVAVTPDVL